MMSVYEYILANRGPDVSFIGDYDLAHTPITITQEVRTMCEQNLCGNYGRNWCCPPNTPPCDTCRMMLSRYPRMVLVRTTFRRRELFDFEEMAAQMKVHNDYARSIREGLKKSGLSSFKILSAGGCGFCRQCCCPDERCRFPDERLFSIEAYGIDLSVFLTENDIDRRAGNEEQSFFIMVFY